MSFKHRINGTGDYQIFTLHDLRELVNRTSALSGGLEVALVTPDGEAHRAIGVTAERVTGDRANLWIEVDPE